VNICSPMTLPKPQEKSVAVQGASWHQGVLTIMW
jgi:hypothetical protein